MLRIGEVATGDHPILARDVHIAFNKKKLLFKLRTSKTHTMSSKPQIIKISALDIKHYNNNNSLCPFYILKEFLVARGGYKANIEAFFVFADRTAITTATVRKTLKNLITNCNFISTAYSFHSLRARRCNNLANSGVSVETLKWLGRWRSNAVFRYLT